MKKQTLIRKEYKGADYLKMIWTKIVSRKKGRRLYIPKYTETADFISLVKDTDAVELPEVFERDQLLGMIEKSGLNGFGGAGFPVAQKLEKVLESCTQAPVLIINGVECDPGLHHDSWILKNRQKELNEVIRVLKNSLDLRQVYLAVAKGGNTVELEGAVTVEVEKAYPAGEEKQIVSTVLGLERDSYSRPSDRGIWVQNIQTILNLHSILAGRSPSRFLTMVNLNEKKSAVVQCSPEASVEELTEMVLGNRDEVYIGGGLFQAEASGAGQKLDARINLIAAGRAAGYPENDCHHCSQCSIHCPVQIEVEKAVEEVRQGRAVSDEIRSKCLNCGSCSYICPAGKDICSLMNN